MTAKIAHLEMIQEVIKRMADSSFRIKGWSVVLVSAIFALSAENTRTSFVFVAYFPVVMFWILDGYFLRQEELFRELYKAVCDKNDGEIDFSMDTDPYKQNLAGWNNACLSPTLSVFHGAVLLLTVLATLLLLGIV